MDDAHIDHLILKSCSQYYLKVARIIVDVCGALGKDATDENGAVIEQRIRALIDRGQLEADGDLSQWRYSEIRLVTKH